MAARIPVVTNICIATGAVPLVGVTVSQGWSVVAVKLSVPAPVLFTFTDADAGFNGLPCTAEKEMAFDERLKDGEATVTCPLPPPPHAEHNDESTHRNPVRQKIDRRLEGSPRQSGPKVRFIWFSPHRLMRNGVAGPYITTTGNREGTNLLEWFAKDNWIPQTNRHEFAKRRRPECVAKTFLLVACSLTFAIS